MWIHEGRLGGSGNTVNGVELPAQTKWVDRYRHVGHTLSGANSLNGARDYYTRPVLGQRVITLQIALPDSWLSQAIYDALLALDTAGAQLALDWEGSIYNVIYNHLGVKALDFTPLDNVNGRPVWNTGLYTGQLNLITLQG